MKSKVLEAKFTRIVERDPEQMAEVRVKVADEPHEAVVYFSKSIKGWDMVHLLQNDANYETDWYDNVLHQAFKELAPIMSEEEKREFTREVLAYGDVQSQLEEALGYLH